MKLKVKNLNLSTAGPLIAVLNAEEARKLDLYALDRIRIKKNNKEIIVVLNITANKKTIQPCCIGLFEETSKALNANTNDIVEISLEKKPDSISYIRKKLTGQSLSENEINAIIDDTVDNKLSEAELTYFVSACYTKGLNIDEITYLTKAIVNTGKQLRLERFPIVDKHSVSGVPNNRTTMLIVPIIAAAGLTMPKTSSRAISSASGTADCMEVLANVSFPVEKIKEIIEKTNACIVWSGAIELASADDKIIKIEYPLSLDPEGMLLSSIMAKKKAVNATHLLIDIPLGKNAKIQSMQRALRLRRLFLELGKRLSIKTKVIITDGRQPIGNGIGPALEARDVLYILTNNKKAPKDLKEKAIYMSGLMLSLAGIRNGISKARQILESGLAYKKMQEIIKAQGGDPNIHPDNIPIGKFTYSFKSKKQGIVKNIDSKSLVKIARIAGAPKDKEAGIYLRIKLNQKVKKNDILFTIYSKNKNKLEYSKQILDDIIEIA